MYERIVRDISLIFNEFKDAPLWFLCNYYTARIRVIGVNLDQGKRNLVRVSEKFELSKGEWAEKKWLKNPREMVSVRSEFKLSKFELHWGSRAVLKYFLKFICIWSVKKNKLPPHANRFPPLLKTIIHKMRRDQERPNQSVFSVHSAFRFNHWRQDVLSPVPSPYPSIDKEIKTTSGYWAGALKDVHRGRPLAFPVIPNIRMILGTPCDLSCSCSRWLTMIKSCLSADVSYFLCCSRKRDVARSNTHLYPFTMSFNGFGTVSG